MPDSETNCRPVIIEVAVNGQTPKEANPNVPRASREIADVCLRCIEGGASIIHTHITDVTQPGEIAAASYLEHFEAILLERPDALLYPTLGFGRDNRARYAHLEILVEKMGLRIGFVDPGSVNLGGADSKGVPIPIDYAYVNTPASIRWAFDFCDGLQLGPSIAIFEPGFLRQMLAYYRSGRLPAGSLTKFYMGGDYGYIGAGHKGVSFGLPGEPWALDVYLKMMGDCSLPWSVGVMGGDVFENGLARHALEKGGHLHVGLEDYMGGDKPSNEELVDRAVALCREVGRPVATIKETEKILGLPR